MYCWCTKIKYILHFNKFTIGKIGSNSTIEKTQKLRGLFDHLQHTPVYVAA